MLVKGEARIQAAASILFMASVTPVAWADRGPYVGGGIGRSVADVDSNNVSVNAVDSGFTSAQTNTVDDTATGWKAFGGVRFHEHFALEGHYVDLGRIKFNTRTTGPNSFIAGRADATAWGVDAMAIYPATKELTVFGKVGVFRWDIDGKVPKISNGQARSGREDDSGYSAKAGIGLSLRLIELVGVRMEAEYYPRVGDKDKIGRADVFFFSASVSMGF